MLTAIVASTNSQSPRRRVARASRAARDAWAFVYVFFTNGIPFDSPNRSEPCPGI